MSSGAVLLEALRGRIQFGVQGHPPSLAEVRLIGHELERREFKESRT